MLGTNDAGKTMNSSDKTLIEIFDGIGKKLKLDIHEFQGVSIRLPADAEGHLGTSSPFALPFPLSSPR